MKVIRGTPLVSVVIPTYRRAGRLPAAISSALAQTVADLEVIVVDDASSDDTEHVVKKQTDPRVRCLRHEKNKGPSASRNTGIRAAQGEYIAFLDDDDEWFSKKLEKQVQFCMEHGCHAVLSASITNDAAIRQFARPEVAIDDLRRGNIFTPGSGLLAQSSVLKELWFDEAIGQGEDWDLLIRMAQSKYHIGYIDEPLFFVSNGDHMRATNEAKHLSGRQLEKRAAILHKHRTFLGERWYKYHLAGTFLAYIGSRSDKITCLSYAVKRCGLRPVAAVLIGKAWRRFHPIAGR